MTPTCAFSTLSLCVHKQNFPKIKSSLFFRIEDTVLISVYPTSLQLLWLILKLGRRMCLIDLSSLQHLFLFFLSPMVINKSCRSNCILFYHGWHFFASVLRHLFLLPSSTSISFQKISSFFLCVFLVEVWN